MALNDPDGYSLCGIDFVAGDFSLPPFASFSLRPQNGFFLWLVIFRRRMEFLSRFKMAAYTQSLIDLVREHRMLYDMSHIDYKSSRKKEQLWCEIGEQLGISGEEAKTKWKNLRDTYSKFLKSVQTRKVNKRKKWLWCDQMDFCRPYLPPAIVPTGVPEVELDITEVSDSIEVDDRHQYIQSFYETEARNSVHIQSVECVQPSGSPSHRVAVESFGVKTPRENHSGKYPADLSPCTSELAESLNDTHKRKFDAIESLFLAHAQTVKKFSPMRQAVTKLKLAELIAQQEMLHLKEES